MNSENISDKNSINRALALLRERAVGLDSWISLSDGNSLGWSRDIDSGSWGLFFSGSGMVGTFAVGECSASGQRIIVRMLPALLASVRAEMDKTFQEVTMNAIDAIVEGVGHEQT